MLNTQRSVWIHIHIPKSGGSTFNSILKRNFGRGFKANYSLLDNYSYSQQQVKRIIDVHQDLTCLADHKVSTDLPFHLNDVDIYGLMTFRDPVDYFLSCYFYGRHHPTNNNIKAKSMNLNDYIQDYLQRKKINDFDFYQSCRATDLPHQEAIEKIKSLLEEEKLYAIPLSRFDEGCLMLEKKFPQYFKDCSYTKKNVSKKDQKVTEKEKQKILEIDKSGFQLEYELFNFVQQKLERSLKELFETEEKCCLEVKMFREKCVTFPVFFKAIITKLVRVNYFFELVKDY